MYAGVPAKAPHPVAALRCTWCLLVWGTNSAASIHEGSGWCSLHRTGRMLGAIETEWAWTSQVKLD